jgi:hypothetical protein
MTEFINSLIKLIKVVALMVELVLLVALIHSFIHSFIQHSINPYMVSTNGYRNSQHDYVTGCKQ